MKREDESYEKWLEQLRTVQPVLKHPNELTASIMQKISRKSRVTDTLLPFGAASMKSRMLVLGSWISVSVAGLLLCLLVNEGSRFPAPIPVEQRELLIFKTPPLSLPHNWEEMDKAEKSHYLASAFGEKELLRMKKEHILESRVKNHIKSVRYGKE